MMKKLSLLMLALSCSLHAQAHFVSFSDVVRDIKEGLVLYQDEESFVREVKLGIFAQYQMALVQPSGSNGQHLQEGASPFNDEFRRVWATLKADFATDTSLNAIWKFGGIPSMESYSNGQAVDNYSYAGLFTLYLDQKIAAVDGLSVKLGKVKTLFLDEYIRPNMHIPTIERSLLYHQYLVESNWGIELRYAPTKNDYVYFQFLANDRACGFYAPQHSDAYFIGDGLKGEFGWEDKAFLVIGGKHRLQEGESSFQDVSFQYTHDFNNVYDGDRQAGANNYGAKVKDALSLGHQLRRENFYLDSALLLNMELQKADTTRGSGKSVGVSIMPRYRISPEVELVARYALVSGKGAVSLSGERYLVKQTTADTLVDSANTFYVGANYFFVPEDPHAVKLMLGAEYLTSRKDGEGAYSGWTYSAAVRVFF